jgi:hypothetical protein
VTIIAPSNILIATSRGTFPLTNLSRLASILAVDIRTQLLRYVAGELKRCISDDGIRSRVILDELDESIVIVSLGGLR